jgi:GT2 family glycosyltransferase
MLNDDVFIDSDCVKNLAVEMKSGVGCVSARLMYPDGTVYFAGKVRRPGERGWGHKNLHQTHWDWKEPTEMENGFTACSLVDREAFYRSGCFDERFFCYAEDDAISLQFRRAGYKLVFQPNAAATHLEHQSTQRLGNIMDVVKKANKIFGEVWGDYYTHNAANSFGNFDY